MTNQTSKTTRRSRVAHNRLRLSQGRVPSVPRQGSSAIPSGRREIGAHRAAAFEKGPFRGGGIGNHRPEGGIFGQLHCHRREEYRSGYASLLFRASAANPPPSGAQRPFPSHLFRRKAGGRRQGGSPSKAGQHSAGANGAEMDRCFPMSPPL